MQGPRFAKSSLSSNWRFLKRQFNIKSQQEILKVPHGDRHFQEIYGVFWWAHDNYYIGHQNAPYIFWKCLPPWGTLIVSCWNMKLTWIQRKHSRKGSIWFYVKVRTLMFYPFCVDSDWNLVEFWDKKNIKIFIDFSVQWKFRFFMLFE